ncbi:MAG: 4-(cytidine 5'-diphospho)-2-C-methyl-D-erythritol kinase [Fibrobacterota bacterium]
MSNPVRTRSYTRLTLALDVIRKLSSGPAAGRHELGIIKQEISLADDIILHPAEETGIICSHPDVPVNEDNICWQAVELLRREFGRKDSFVVEIIKRIPVQGGLAGGSTNAAAVLRSAAQQWGLGCSRQDLVRMGRTLGMDVPFYFYGGTAFDSEATEVLRPIATGLKLWYVLVIPSFGVSTKEAYGGLNYEKTGRNTALTTTMEEALAAGDYDGVCRAVHNDFEVSLDRSFPQIQALKRDLCRAGCDAAVLSGSGSTVVGIAATEKAAQDAARKFTTAIVAETR